MQTDDHTAHVQALFAAEGPGGMVHWALRDTGALTLGIQVLRDGRGWFIRRSEQPCDLSHWAAGSAG